MAGDTALAGMFRALGDATRLGLLAALREEGEQRAGDLAARYPQLSRPAVSKHLGVLREAGLVQAKRRGTERWYRIDPAPFGELDRTWFSVYRELWASHLERLKELVEEEPPA